MSTTGELLIQKLNLSKIKHIYARRSIGLSIPILHIVFDSFRQNFPLSKGYILSKFNNDFYMINHHMLWTPFFDLTKYNGHLNSILFLINDLAGSYLAKTNLYKESITIIEKPDSIIIESMLMQEYLQLADLMKSQGMSNFTRKFRKQRTKVLGTENKLSKLVDVDIDKPDNSITFKWLTDATTPIYPDDYQYKEVDPESKELINDPSKVYELNIKILQFFDWLDVFEGQTVTEKELKEIFKVSNVQVWSSDPSFHWQGMNYWSSQLDASIYPTDIKPKRWDKPELHGEDNAFIGKHLTGLINGIAFWLSPMASMLNKILKNKGFLK
jgi:hypothetical protein